MAVNQLKMGAALNYAVIILNTLVGLLYTPYMLQMMGQSEYGLYSLVASVIAYLTVLDLGFGNAIMRYTAKFRAENKEQEQYEMFGMFLILYIVIGFVAFFVGLGLFFNIETFFGKTMTPEEICKTQIMVLILVFNLAITFPFSIFSSIINAYEHFLFPRSINILRIILNTLVMVVLLSYGYKAIAMAMVQTLFNILTLLLHYFYCRTKLKIHIIYGKFNWAFFQEVTTYSFWIFLFVVMDKVYWSTGQFILGSVSGTVAVAVYAVAIQLQGMYMQFSNSIASLFLPKVTVIITKNDDKVQISNLFIRTGRIQYIIILYILVSFIVFGRQFICLWAGSNYAESYLIASIFFIPLTVPLIQNIGVTILQARNQMKFRSILYIIIAFISLMLQVVLSKQMGGIGCALAVSGSLIIGQIIIMNIYYSKKQFIDIRGFWVNIISMTKVPFIYGMLAYFFFNKILIITNWQTFTISIILFTSVYVPLFYRFAMNSEEKNIIKSAVSIITNNHV